MPRVASFPQKCALILALTVLGAVLIISFRHLPNEPIAGEDEAKSDHSDVLQRHHPKTQVGDRVSEITVQTAQPKNNLLSEGVMNEVETTTMTARPLSKDIINKAEKFVSTTMTAQPKSDLSQDLINKVEKFVFFIGYPRSGHSIVGSFMDAHPHMVVAHEFMLFRKVKELSLKQEMDKISLLQNKSYLFNSLYHASIRDSKMGWRSRSSDSKNYTLTVDSPWVGKYDRYISVIGDKCGGITSNTYNESPGGFTAHYKQLKHTVRIPIKVFHCIRNPYDMVSTNTLYKMAFKAHPHDPYKFVSLYKENMSKLGYMEFMKARYNNERMLEDRFNLLESQARAVSNIIDLVGADNTLELHNSELVTDPKSALTKICAFLEVDCSAKYLKTCSEKVFKSVSKSRELVVWPQTIRNRMDDLIRRYPFFHRYSFNGE